ncbi:LacI family DNA-binding transcriptional regulator [Parablautia muri]|uniref:LacI family transcriptional regulator n=1 Tax=Parablautia muri TaxID=2320879 RepID=A0A9X5BGF8_9FIRM|nr:LacI family DNA-binding transcriptional regulator [Parablautia muri]NBJ93254.1 LacI family transcriptional regulator [Parablautia muri]
MKKVTLKMIAEEAGVSVSCVTRYVNKSGYVSAEKKKRLDAVLERMDYIPNQQARFLRGGRSNLIGHIHQDSDENIFFTKMAVSIEKKSFEKGYRTISYVQEAGNVQALKDIISDVCLYGVDGIIINSGDCKEMINDIERILMGVSIPVVMIERPADVYGIEKILIDNEEGSYIATKKLYNAGHKQIAFLGVKQNSAVENERYYGYQQAMKGINHDYAKEHSYFVDEYSVEDGYRETKRILESCGESQRPTAILVASDILAAGVYRALMELSINIPEDISIVGYDDTIAQFLSPPLSTLQLPVEEIGEAAVETLISKINNPAQFVKTIKISPVFVERNSIKRICP